MIIKKRNLILGACVTGALLNYINDSDIGTIYQRISFILGNVSFNDTISLIMTATVWFFPQIVLFLFAGNYLEISVIDIFPYVRTRTDDISSFLLRLWASLFLIVALFYAMIIMISVFVFMYSGENHIVPEDIPYLILSVLLYIVYYTLILILGNSLSMRYGAVNSTVATLLSQGILLFLAMKMKGSAVCYLLLPCWVLFRRDYQYNAAYMTAQIGILLLCGSVVFLLSKRWLNQKEDI